MMSREVQALVALDSSVDRGLVETLVSAEPLRVLDYVDIGHANGNGAAGGDVLIVACSDYTTEVGEYLADAAKERPARPVVLVAPTASNGYVARAIDAGADDILALPSKSDDVGTLAAQLVFSVEKALARKRAPDLITRHGAMICVLGLKGGSGKTLTSTNLAVALADAGHRVTIVDLDLQFGDVGLALGLAPEKTVYDLVRSGGSLDAPKIEDFLMVHDSGLRALLAPARPDEAGAITGEFLHEVYALLRDVNDFVIVDTPPSFTPTVIGAVDSATDQCMVAMLDSLSLKNARLGLETLERMGCDVARVRLVLNRADTHVGIGRDDVAAILGATPDVFVPSDREVTRSINHGGPIVLERRRSDAAKAFRSLADLYEEDGRAAGRLPALPASRRLRLFRRSSRES
jgi:pilus assembly protein CpaE